MAYSEQPTALAGTVLWQRPANGPSVHMLVLPDGCMDLIWDGVRLFVAGPDRAARWTDSRDHSSYAALRFSGGTGPAVLGIPADACTDQSPALDELWPAGEARRLTEQVAADPAGALHQLAASWTRTVDVDPFGARVLAMADAGWSVASMSDRLGTTVRHLHRKSLATFGYGPRHLARIMRFGRAVSRAADGRALAEVAAECGYADQAHLTREFKDLAGTTPLRLVATLDDLHPAALTEDRQASGRTAALT